MEIRHDWARDEIRHIYHLPVPDLIFQAQLAHRAFHKADEIQICRLLSIKTGGCPEDCAYCSQSAHYETGVVREGLMNPVAVREAAKCAKNEGATRFCMGAAWSRVSDGENFDRVLDMVRAVAALDMEVCCTLGMLTESQAKLLKAAGLTAYNHNLDTSPEFYGNIITTRVYEDRIGLLHELSRLNPHPESVPVNMLVRNEGTPLADVKALEPLVMVRAIATARVLMPASRVRLAAGRREMSSEAVTLCFLAGANSIFTGKKLLTTPNPPPDADQQLLENLGMKAMQGA